MKEKFDVILFDLDGTLTNSAEGVTKCVQYALKRLGIEEPDLKKLERFIGPPLIDSFMKYYGMTREEAINARNIYTERYHPIGWRENYPYEGIAGVLEELKKSGKVLAVATSKPDNMSRLVLEEFDLLKYFTVLAAATNDGIHCDKAERILNALEELKALGYAAENPVLVGDTKFDVEGAHKCNLPCIGVRWGFAEEGELEACGAEYTVNDMAELTALLT
ncbi:MAG: HAD hydrolase-like protein [Lachnospiraceae bacterium]